MTPILTEQGKNLLLGALAGKTITFTKVRLGNGTDQNSDVLTNPLITAPLTKISIGNDYVTLTAALSNGTVTTGFHATEVGFYAQDPDDGSDDPSEILYAIGHEDMSTADYIPDKNSRILEMEYSALLFIGKAQNIAAAINSSLVYATKQDFDNHTADRNNPHNVTKEQIGLGNVPNLATNDQTPTFAPADNLKNIESGEKISVLFGKIKTSLSALLSHIINKQNPHGCTAAQIGAAPKSHTHTADQINAGTLPVRRGGTGVSSYAALASSLAKNGLSTTKVVTGSYKGNGNYGKYLYNELTFDTPPKMLIVMPTYIPNDYNFGDNDYIGTIDGFAIINGVTNYRGLTINWTDNGVMWYSPYDVLKQCNDEGIEYQYLAIL